MARPTKYDPKYCEMLIEHMSKGLSYECFGPSINVATSNVYEWEKKHPEFQEAKKEAFGQSRLFWEKEGIDGLWNEQGEKQLNNTIWIFNMKNRFGWADKKEIEHTVNEISINVDADDDEL